MPLRSWLLENRPATRALAAGVLVLSAGGLVLLRHPASARPLSPPPLVAPPSAPGLHVSTFAGPGAHGRVALSHDHVLADRPGRVVAEVTLTADADERAMERAPLSIAVVLDTSGSMGGEKIEQAKASVARLVADMRDDDEIALVRYSDDAEVVQPLARVGAVRRALDRHVKDLEAAGGTAIPRGLRAGLRTLDEAGKGRVRRVVLVSDGLDGTRVEAEELARSSFGRGVVVSALGVGLDFDEAYMSSVSRAGHGNFAFVKNGAAMASFLRRELDETAATTIEDARVRLELPPGLRFVRASGADAQPRTGEVELTLGALFAGDERRAVVELEADAREGQTLRLGARAAWARVGGGAVDAEAPALTLLATRDAAEAERSRDTGVLATWTSVTASERQLEATEAYAKGDVDRASSLIRDNVAALRQAAAVAPPAAATALAAQMQAYDDTKAAFGAAAPSSDVGKAEAKKAAAKENGNLARKAW